jgi:hypothetical protein
MTEWRETKRTPGLIIEPMVADEEAHKKWFRDGLREAKCQICRAEIKVGDTFAFTYTNHGDHIGGNPCTCSECLKIPFERRIAWWDAQHDQELIAKMLRNLFIGGEK